MRRRVRLTESQLRGVVEEASRRVIQEMMDEGFGDYLLNAGKRLYNGAVQTGKDMYNAGKDVVKGGLKTVGNLGALAGGTVASVPLLAASVGAGAASTALGDGYTAGERKISEPYGDYMTQRAKDLWNGMKQMGSGMQRYVTAPYTNQASGSTQQQRR